MVSINDAQQLKITESEIKDCIKRTLKETFNQVDNLRHRNKTVQFDCLLRGYIGELSIKNWFNDYGIHFQETNYMKDDGGNIDIDLLFIHKNISRSIEIKTSLVPDNFVKNIENKNIKEKIDRCIKTCDIKLIRRNDEPIHQLKGDIHIQVYFADRRKGKEDFLKTIDLDLENKQKSIEEKVNHIYNVLHAYLYQKRTFLVAWIDKKTLIKQIEQKDKKDQSWSFKDSKREFWNCKIRTESKKPLELIAYFKNIQKRKNRNKLTR